MTPSSVSLRLSDVVGELVSELSFLHEPLRHGLVNYSALARMIKPAVDRRLGQKVSPEAITMALRRREGLSSLPRNPALYDVVSQCKTNVQTDLAVVHYPYSEELVQKVNRFKQELKISGEKLYVVQRSDELSIVIHSRFLPELHRLSGKTKAFAENRNQALLTIAHPPRGYDTQGLLTYFLHQFNEAGVNIWMVFSTFTSVSFLVDEAQAALMYERLTRSIRGVKDLA